MKNAIIERSILELQRNGLKFSIDEVARSLNISKKTIYKFFSAKEQLAIEIYKTFYENALRELETLSKTRSKDAAAQILEIYYRSHCMIRDDIFNKYALNASIRAPAQTNHARIRTFVERLLTQSDQSALMVIIDGALQKLYESNNEKEEVIARLVTFIC